MNPHLLKSVFWTICLASQAVFLWPVLAGPTLESAVVAIVACGLFATHWDRKLRFSFSALSAPLLCTGLSISLIAGAMGLPWLGSWGFLLSVTAFFADQSDKSGNSMLQLGFLFAGCIALPASLERKLADLTTDSIVGTSQMILYATGTPHLADHTEFEYVGKTVEVFSSPWVTWRLSFIITIVYSVLRRRRWSTTIANMASATFCWYSFRFMMLTCPALVPAMPGQACLPVCSLISVLLFLSLERGVRTLLEPVPDDAGASQYANPMIEIWNRMENPAVTAVPEQPRKALIFSLCLVGLLIGGSHFISGGMTDSSPDGDESSQAHQRSASVEES